ncbi:hypothetical protein [Franconibacter pulveris]|uniref:Uncharacterized protein n=1 Tax=Franconibacter pulveris TaxID=435910 RepID=A0A0J8VLG9_9ENTR|nr:hypothetical protein [Franconibacter pulveris]KMV33882.1 hypothetical protein ACH50_14320 [Franconibacter pulveris]
MEEGFYWVLYAGTKLIAWYADEETLDYLTGERIRGVWHFMGASDFIATRQETTVLSGPLMPPADR